MQKGGFEAICEPQSPVLLPGIGTETAEKLVLPVEMRGYSVLRCKPCGHFLPELARKRTRSDLAGTITPLERNARLRVKHENL